MTNAAYYNRHRKAELVAMLVENDETKTSAMREHYATVGELKRRITELEAAAAKGVEASPLYKAVDVLEDIEGTDVRVVSTAVDGFYPTITVEVVGGTAGDIWQIMPGDRFTLANDCMAAIRTVIDAAGDVAHLAKT